jgi:tetratricopeptide (TPR) repeat protein
MKSDSPRGAAWLTVLVVFLVALLLRLWYLTEIVDLPDFDYPRVDAQYHDYWAAGIATGEWPDPPQEENPSIESRPFFRPPLYAYFLGFIYWLFGHDYLLARVVQMVIGSLSCVLVYFLARKIFGPRAAALSGLLAATYWTTIYFEGEFQPPVLLIFLDVVFLLLLTDLSKTSTLLTPLGAGVVLGLSAMARPNILLFLPIAVIYCFLKIKPRGARRSIVAACLLVVGTAGAVAPATIRNYVVGGDTVLISSNGGVNLFFGNNPDANGYAVTISQFATSFDHDKLVRYVESEMGREIKDSEASAYWASQAWDNIKVEPTKYLSLAVKKAVLFWGAREIYSNKVHTQARKESRALKPSINFAMAASLAFVGLFVTIYSFIALRRTGGPRAKTAPDRESAIVVALFIAVYFASFLPFFVNARYRAVIVPFLLIFAGFAIDRAFAWARGGRPLSAVGALTGAAAVFGILHIEPYKIASEPAKWFFDLGSTLGAKGEFKEAEIEYRKALKLNPEYAPALFDLALVYEQLGRLDESVLRFEEVVRLRPKDARARFNLARILQTLGRRLSARDRLREAVEIDPAFEEARLQYASMLIAERRIADATDLLRRGLDHSPDSIVVLDLLARILLESPQPELRNPQEALVHAERACRITNRQNPWLLARLAVAQAETGDFRSAIASIEKAQGLPEGRNDVELSVRISKQLADYRLRAAGVDLGD